MKRRSFLKAALIMTGSVVLAPSGSLVGAATGEENAEEMVGKFSVPNRTTGVNIQENAGQTVLVSSQDNRLILNETAELVWNNIDGKRTSFDLAQILTDTFQIHERQALCDVMNLLTAFKEENILEVRQVSYVYSKKIKM